jgi:hypothetical protein
MRQAQVEAALEERLGEQGVKVLRGHELTGWAGCSWRATQNVAAQNAWSLAPAGPAQPLPRPGGNPGGPALPDPKLGNGFAGNLFHCGRFVLLTKTPAFPPHAEVVVAEVPELPWPDLTRALVRPDGYVASPTGSAAGWLI